jgi:hypothetical protein
MDSAQLEAGNISMVSKESADSLQVDDVERCDGKGRQLEV